MTLNDLKQNIASVIAKMKANLTGKGVAVDESDTLHTLADKVNDINIGEISIIDLHNTKFAYSTFTEIPEYIKNSNWDEITSVDKMFLECNLSSVDGINTEHITSFVSFLEKNRNLTYFPNISFASAVTLNSCFSQNTSLKYVNELNAPNVIFFNNTFWGCTSLTEIGVINIYSSQSNFAFENCTSLKKIGQINASFKLCQNIFNKCTSLEYIKMISLGGWSNNTTYDFSGATIWGTGSDENKQSVIDSLITYSHNRLESGFSVGIIKLSNATKALLTEDEITQITNKGYTIA